MPDDLNKQMIEAARDGRTADMNGFLDRGAEVHSTRFACYTALHYAAGSGHDGCVDSLVKRGANVNALTDIQSTPLLLAAYNGHPSTVQKLLAAGADPTLKDGSGATALDDAKSQGHTECIRLLQNPAAAAAVPALARDDSVEVVGERSKAEIDAKKRKAAVVVDDDEGPALKAERASTSSSGSAAASSSSSAARAPELMELLREAGVGDKVAAAEKWCRENGADSLAEIKETSSEEDLVEALQLLPVKAKLVLGRIVKWQPPQPLDEAQLSAKKVPELKELCQKRGLSDQGKKAELVARLLE